jgi:hypothetical protein
MGIAIGKSVYENRKFSGGIIIKGYVNARKGGIKNKGTDHTNQENSVIKNGT